MKSLQNTFALSQEMLKHILSLKERRQNMKFLITIMALVVSVQVQASVCRIAAYDDLYKKYDDVLERVSIGGGMIDKGLRSGKMKIACIVIKDLIKDLTEMDKEFNSMLTYLADESVTAKYAATCGMTQNRMNNLSAVTQEVVENNLGMIEVLEEYNQNCK